MTDAQFHCLLFFSPFIHPITFTPSHSCQSTCPASPIPSTGSSPLSSDTSPTTTLQAPVTRAPRPRPVLAHQRSSSENTPQRSWQSLTAGQRILASSWPFKEKSLMSPAAETFMVQVKQKKRKNARDKKNSLVLRSHNAFSGTNGESLTGNIGHE